MHAIGWNGTLLIFCQSWPWTAILMISTSLIVRITGASHHAQPWILIPQWGILIPGDTQCFHWAGSYQPGQIVHVTLSPK
jgi:hypothetical protein